MYCNYMEERCFANLEGNCEILCEPVKGKAKCPFYKTDAEYAEGWIKYPYHPPYEDFGTQGYTEETLRIWKGKH